MAHVADASKKIDQFIADYVKQAIKINESGVKAAKPELPMPADFKKALISSKLLEKFQKMPYTHRKEYILSILDSKKPETRERRIVKNIEMIAHF